MTLKQQCLRGASAVAIAAALAVLPDTAEAACYASASLTGGVPQSVSVSCSAVNETNSESEAFATSFENVYFLESAYQDYDGESGDQVTVSSGTIVQGIINEDPESAPFPPIILDTYDFYSPYTLDDRTTYIETLGGDDTFRVTSETDLDGNTVSGAVGTASANVSIYLGAGADTFIIEAGDVYGSVFGGEFPADPPRTDEVDGNDSFTVNGGTVHGSLIGDAGDDNIAVNGGSVFGNVEGGDGNDTLTVGRTDSDDTGQIGQETLPTAITLGAGADIFTLNSGVVYGTVDTGAGDDSLTVAGGQIGSSTVDGSVFMGAGADGFSMSAGTIYGSVFGQGGSEDAGSVVGNAFTITGGTIDGLIFTGAQNDTVSISGTTSITGRNASPDAIGLEDGDDIFVMTSGSVGAAVSGGNGVDQLRMEGGTITGFLAGNAGDDAIIIVGGTIQGGVQGNEGADQITMSGGSTGVVTGDEGSDTIGISGTAQVESVQGAAGADIINVTGGAVSSNVTGGNDNDSISIAGGTVQTGVSGDAGDDVLTASGGTVSGGLNGDAGNDIVNVSGTATVNGGANGGDGDDAVNVSGGTVNGGANGGAGADTVTISGGTVSQNVAGGDGSDTVEMRGGTVSGSIEAETVRLYGGTIGGDISGLTGNTLVIDDAETAEALVLRDGVVFSGSNAVGTIEDSNLAAGGFGQNFSGFSSLSLANSTLRFEGGTQTIDNLFLTGGSTLFIDGITTLAAQNGGLGSLSATGSTISMVDGDPSDQLSLGGIVLDSATIGIDVNQSAGLSDLLTASGTVSASGNNVVLVNLVGDLELTDTTEIAILTANGTELGGVFTVEGISGTAASLFDYEVVEGPNGGLVLRATPITGLIGLVSSLDAASSAAALETSMQALEGINDDAIEHALGLAGGAGAPSDASFGVFASGQFARVEHDGFSISDGATTFAGPSFSSDDFSAAISVDFNAAKHWGFDAEYGLNLGVFAGFTSTYLAADGYGSFASVGSAENESGMGGVYALMRRQQNYLLLSATGFWGETHSVNGVLDGAEGEYATNGYAVTASAGHIFALGAKTRFDLRGGVLGASFTGDAYTDSRGVQHGETEISFGAVKFEPGIYAEHVLENGMIFSPYARADLQLRFGYENTASTDARSFEFDDEDFSAALASGFNLRMNESTTLSGELRGKASSDSTTLAAKLGLKVAF